MNPSSDRAESSLISDMRESMDGQNSLNLNVSTRPDRNTQNGKEPNLQPPS